MTDLDGIYAALMSEGRIVRFIAEFNEDSAQAVQDLIDEVSDRYNNPSSSVFSKNFQQEKMEPLIALMFYRQKDNLNLIEVGNYLNVKNDKSRQANILRNFVAQIDFTGQNFVEAIKTYLSYIDVPLGSDAKSHVIKCFVNRCIDCNSSMRVNFSSSDAACNLVKVVLDELRSQQRKNLKEFKGSVSGLNTINEKEHSDAAGNFPDSLLEEIHSTLNKEPVFTIVPQCIIRHGIQSNSVCSKLSNCKQKTAAENIIPGLQGCFIEPVFTGWQLLTGTNKTFKVTNQVGEEIALINLYVAPKTAKLLGLGSLRGTVLDPAKTTNSLTIKLISKPDREGVPLEQSIEVADKIVATFASPSTVEVSSSHLWLTQQLEKLLRTRLAPPSDAEKTPTSVVSSSSLGELGVSPLSSSSSMMASQASMSETSEDNPLVTEVSSSLRTSPSEASSDDRGTPSYPGSQKDLDTSKIVRSSSSPLLFMSASHSSSERPSSVGSNPTASSVAAEEESGIPEIKIFRSMEEVRNYFPSQLGLDITFNITTKPAGSGQIYVDFIRFPLIKVENSITKENKDLKHGRFTSSQEKVDSIALLREQHDTIDQALRILLDGLVPGDSLKFEKCIRGFAHQGGFLHAIQSLIQIPAHSDIMQVMLDEKHCEHVFTFTCTKEGTILMKETLVLPPSKYIELLKDDAEKGMQRVSLGEDENHNIATISLTSKLSIDAEGQVKSDFIEMSLIPHEQEACETLFPKVFPDKARPEL